MNKGEQEGGGAGGEGGQHSGILSERTFWMPPKPLGIISRFRF